MIRLYEHNEEYAKSRDEALYYTAYTGFNKEDFKCEVIQEPKRTGLFRKEDGIYHCWYEYQGMDADKEFRIVDAHLYADTKQKKILVIRFGFKAYEIDYSDLLDYEMVVVSSSRTYTISNKNKALKGAILYGVTGAIIGAADSETVTGTSEIAELIIRLRFKNKESFEILTCNQKYNITTKAWRDILDQSEVAGKFFQELLED